MTTNNMSEQSGNEQIAKDLTNKVWLGCLSMDQLTSLMTSIKAVLDKKDSAHAAELEASRKLIDELKTMLSYGGLAEVRTCCKCRKPYPEFRVMSTMTCGNCRLAELQANVERLETTTAVLRGSCDSYMEQNSNLHKMVDELKASELVWLNQKSVAERRVDQLETDLRQAGEIIQGYKDFIAPHETLEEYQKAWETLHDEAKEEIAALKAEIAELRGYCTLTFGESHPEHKICVHEAEIAKLRKLLADCVEVLRPFAENAYDGEAFNFRPLNEYCQQAKSVLERVKELDRG